MVEWSFCQFQAAGLNIEENSAILGEFRRCQIGDFEIRHGTGSFSMGHHTNSPGLALRSP